MPASGSERKVEYRVGKVEKIQQRMTPGDPAAGFRF
jgi:hypothetical protein